jgi:N-methylhydantoinase B
VDPVALEIAHHRLASIAEEMGVVLGRTALSPNIKERRDFSCALFDAGGGLVAQAAHIPVHLGSTPLAVRAVIDRVPMGPGDVAIVNDPFAGGTHLPDVTLVAPVHLPGGRTPFAFVANRAHHADIGGMSPGSMPLATEIFQEGFRLPPVRLVSRGRLVPDVLALFLANTRVPSEREGDLMAQWAALRVGAGRLRDLAGLRGARRLAREMRALQRYSEALMRATLATLPTGTYRAADVLDDDGHGAVRLQIRVAITLAHGRARVDFTGTAPQTRGPVNANLAVTRSAVLYVFTAFAADEIPPNDGLARPLTIFAPEGTIVNARFPAAVAGGNVETSQRIVDVLLRALARAAPARVPAASAGSMNNVAIGGGDPYPFAYYETLAGGAGGGPQGAGLSAIHTHMTNTMNTPVEALEAYYPLRVRRYGIRRGSHGKGAHRGGDGVVREIEFLSPAEVTLLAERRRVAPWGLAGGGPGATGRDWIVRDGRRRRIPAKVSLTVQSGDRLRIETPGGGGFGRPGRR